MPIENHRKWLYQLLLIKYELKLPSEAMPLSIAIENQIEAVCTVLVMCLLRNLLKQSLVGN